MLYVILALAAVAVVIIIVQMNKKTKAKKAKQNRQEAKERYENFSRKMNPEGVQEANHPATKPEPEPKIDSVRAEQAADLAIRQKVAETDLVPIFENNSQFPFFTVETDRNTSDYTLLFHSRYSVAAPSADEDREAFLAYCAWSNSEYTTGEIRRVKLFDLRELIGSAAYDLVKNSEYHRAQPAQVTPLGTYLAEKYHCEMVTPNVYINPKSVRKG